MAIIVYGVDITLVVYFVAGIILLNYITKRWIAKGSPLKGQNPDEDYERKIIPTELPKQQILYDVDRDLSYNISDIDLPLYDKDNPKMWSTTYYLLEKPEGIKVMSNQVWREVDPYMYEKEYDYTYYSSRGFGDAKDRRIFNLNKELSRTKLSLQGKDKKLDFLSSSMENQTRLEEERKGARWRDPTRTGKRWNEFPTENQKNNNDQPRDE